MRTMKGSRNMTIRTCRERNYFFGGTMRSMKLPGTQITHENKALGEILAPCFYLTFC